MKKFPLLWLALATCLVYFPILQNEFCLDDAIVSSLPYEDLGFWKLFSSPIPHQLIDHYRPLTFLTFWLDHYLWDTPFAYHFSNILWQIICSFCVYLLAQQLIPKHAFSIAIFFAVFPAHSEAVISIYNRSQVMSSAFMFLSLWLALQYQRQRMPWILWFSGLAIFLGALAKESTLVTPALVVLIALWQKNTTKRLICELVLIQSFFVFLYLALRLVALDTLSMPGVDAVLKDSSSYQTWLYSCYIFAQYWKLGFLPFPLSCDYVVRPVQEWPEHQYYALVVAIFVTVALIYTAYGLLKFRQLGITHLCLWWMFLCLLPVLHFVELQIPMAERLLHAGSFAIVVIIARMCDSQKILLGVVITCFSILTIKNCYVWHNNDSLWQHTIKANPQSFRAKIYLANRVASQNPQKAYEYLLQAINDKPNRDNLLLIYHNMAKLFLTQDNSSLQAVKLLEEIIRIYPKYAPAWLHLGEIHSRQGSWESAASCYQNATEEIHRWRIRPELVLDKIGKCFIRAKNLPQAFASYKRALAYAPQNYSLYISLGAVGIQGGFVDETLEYLVKAVNLKDKPFEIHYLLSVIWNLKQDKDRALYHQQQAKNLCPENIKMPEFVLPPK